MPPKKNSMMNLPRPVLTQIMSYLSPRNKAKVSTLSKGTRNAVKNSYPLVNPVPAADVRKSSLLLSCYIDWIRHWHMTFERSGVPVNWNNVRQRIKAMIKDVRIRLQSLKIPMDLVEISTADTDPETYSPGFFSVRVKTTRESGVAWSVGVTLKDPSILKTISPYPPINYKWMKVDIMLEQELPDTLNWLLQTYDHLHVYVMSDYPVDDDPIFSRSTLPRGLIVDMEVYEEYPHDFNSTPLSYLPVIARAIILASLSVQKALGVGVRIRHTIVGDELRDIKAPVNHMVNVYKKQHTRF